MGAAILLAVTCGLLVFITLVGPGESKSRGFLDKPQKKNAIFPGVTQVDFVSTMYNPKSGELEVRVSLGDVQGMEMVVPGVGENGVFARRITDGKRVVYGIYTSVDNLADCGMGRTEDAKASFDEMFSLEGKLYKDIKRAQIGENEEVPSPVSNHHAINHTVLLPSHDGEAAKRALEQYRHLADFGALARACKTLYKQVITDEKEKLHAEKHQMLPNNSTELSSVPDEETSDPDSHHRSKRYMLIYPNTKWCGAGSSARSYGDLGENKPADRCCREHDHCPDYIERFTSKFNLFNYRLHTISSCNCDKAFRKCLKEVSDSTADMVGNIYFNVIGITCFRMKKERTCTERSWWGTCNKWNKTASAVAKVPKPYKRKIRKK